jgi:periplasmic protein TonB
MFEQSLMDLKAKTNKPWTIVVSFAIQCTIIGVAVLIPLIYYDALPRTQLTSFLTAPPPPPPPPPPAAAAPPRIVHIIPRQFDAGRLMAPKSIPKTIAMIKEDELPPPTATGGVYGGIAGGVSGGVLGGIMSSVGAAAPPPPPPPVKEVKTPVRIRVGGNVQSAMKIRGPVPQYPPLAKQARIQGTVRFTAVIGRDGTIQNLQLISGHPLLVGAAQAAVSQWVYRPTLLNGEPVEVITQIDVNFTLSQ